MALSFPSSHADAYELLWCLALCGVGFFLALIGTRLKKVTIFLVGFAATYGLFSFLSTPQGVTPQDRARQLQQSLLECQKWQLVTLGLSVVGGVLLMFYKKYIVSVGFGLLLLPFGQMVWQIILDEKELLKNVGIVSPESKMWASFAWNALVMATAGAVAPLLFDTAYAVLVPVLVSVLASDYAVQSVLLGNRVLQLGFDKALPMSTKRFFDFHNVLAPRAPSTWLTQAEISKTFYKQMKGFMPGKSQSELLAYLEEHWVPHLLHVLFFGLAFYTTVSRKRTKKGDRSGSSFSSSDSSEYTALNNKRARGYGTR